MDSSLEFSNSLPARYRTFKIIVVGDSGVGKTCLTHRFCSREVLHRTEATIGVDFRERMVDIEGEKIKLQLWDTAGQERFRKSMVQHYYRSVHAVLFVYDVSCPASFRDLPSWMEECRQNSLDHSIPRFLVGNKCDLRSDPHGGETVGHVSQEQALAFAKSRGMTLFETSAKSPPSKGTHNGGGGRDGGVAYHQDKVEAIVMALALKLKRQTKSAMDTRGLYESFKLPAMKRPEKDQWTCTC